MPKPLFHGGWGVGMLGIICVQLFPILYKNCTIGAVSQTAALFKTVAPERLFAFFPLSNQSDLLDFQYACSAFQWDRTLETFMQITLVLKGEKDA